MQNYRRQTKDGCYGYSRNRVTGQITLTKNLSSDAEAYLWAQRVGKNTWNIGVESCFTKYSTQTHTYASSDTFKEVWCNE